MRCLNSLKDYYSNLNNRWLMVFLCILVEVWKFLFYQWVQVPKGWVKRGWSQAFFSGAQGQDQRLQECSETQKLPSEHQTPFFTVIMIEHWHSLPTEITEYPSLEIFKIVRSWSWATPSGWSCLNRELDKMISRGLFLNCSVILWLESRHSPHLLNTFTIFFSKRLCYLRI